MIGGVCQSDTPPLSSDSMVFFSKRECLLRELTLAAFHEAGHAVFYKTLNIPLYTTRIYVKNRFIGAACVGGRTCVSAWPCKRIYDIDSFVLGCLAGPEAEARVLSITDGVPLRDARIYVNSHGGIDDYKMVYKLFSGAACFRYEDAREKVLELMDDNWTSVFDVAQVLVRSFRLFGSDVDRILART